MIRTFAKCCHCLAIDTVRSVMNSSLPTTFDSHAIAFAQSESLLRRAWLCVHLARTGKPSESARSLVLALALFAEARAMVAHIGVRR
jgi:hypothetical protein